MSNQQRNLGWQFFDTEESDNRAWETLLSAIGEGQDQDPGQARSRHPGRKRWPRDLLVVMLFIAALLWLGPWQNSDETGLPARQPVIPSSRSMTVHMEQREKEASFGQIPDRQTLAGYQMHLSPEPGGMAKARAERYEQIADRQELADYQATLAPGYVRGGQ